MNYSLNENDSFPNVVREALWSPYLRHLNSSIFVLVELLHELLHLFSECGVGRVLEKKNLLNIHETWGIRISGFNLWSMNSPLLLLSGPSPIPWRSSPAPSPRCSHCLEDTQTKTACNRNTPQRTSLGIADMQKPHQQMWSRCRTDPSTARFLPGIDSNMSLLPVAPFLPLPSGSIDKAIDWHDANWSLLKDCVFTGL